VGRKRKDRIRNEIIREKVGATKIEDKMRENRLRWYGRIQGRHLDASVRKSDRIVVFGEARGRGRPKLTWVEVVNKDMRIMNVTEHMVLHILNREI